MSQVTKTKRRIKSNREKIEITVNKYPGLRFHQIKSQTKIANGTVQHHLDQLVKSKSIQVNYQKQIKAYINKRNKDSKKFVFPQKCPSCGSLTLKDFNETTKKQDAVRRCIRGFECDSVQPAFYLF